MTTNCETRVYWQAGIPDADDLADEPPALDAARAAEALEVFAAWATADQADGDAIVNLLFELPWQVVLEQPRWVRRLLEGTEGKLREDIMPRCSAGCSAARGSPGSRRRPRGSRPANRPGPLPGELYEALQRAALHHQEQERRDDEELDAGWG